MIILVIIAGLALIVWILFSAVNLLVPALCLYAGVITVMSLFSSEREGSWHYREDRELAKEYEAMLRQEKRDRRREEREYQKEMRRKAAKNA